MAVQWNERSLADLEIFVSDEALHIVGGRTRDEAAASAPRLRSKPAGRGSFPRVHAGYLSEHISEDYGHDADGLAYVDVGGATPEARALIRYRGGAGGVGAYGGSRRQDPFLIYALEAQRGRPVP